MSLRLTRHARDRAAQRRIPISVIEQVVRHPDQVRVGRHDPDREVRSRIYDGQVIEVVVDRLDGSVVTVWARRIP